MKFILLISVFVGDFGSLGCGSSSSRPKSKRIHADPGPDPQTGENFNLFELLEQIRIRNTDPDFGSNYFFNFFLSREKSLNLTILKWIKNAKVFIFYVRNATFLTSESGIAKIFNADSQPWLFYRTFFVSF
jgi:hypothetical protein